MRDVHVGGHVIGPGQRPFVIAEMSGNHNGSLERALSIVDAAAAAGVQALKLQTYTADTMTIKSERPEFRLGNHALWGGRTLYDLYIEAHLPWDWHAPIFERAREHGLVPFSTPFDQTSVAFLEDLGVELYKTASAELVDLELMKEIGRTRKPVIMSTGMGSIAEIDAAVTTIRNAGCEQLVLLACTAAYPALPHEARLGNIETLRRVFDVPVGLSDHTAGVGIAIAGVALGAVAVEKHLTLAREDGGVDSAFSMTPQEMALLVAEAERAFEGVQSGTRFGPTEEEQAVLRLRRSLYVTRAVKAGDVAGADNVRSIRPANGLPVSDWETVVGRRFTRDVSAGTPLSWDVI